MGMRSFFVALVAGCAPSFLLFPVERERAREAAGVCKRERERERAGEREKGQERGGERESRWANGYGAVES
jgi:hypothetical protein